MASNHRLSPLCVGSTPTSDKAEDPSQYMTLAVEWDIKPELYIDFEHVMRMQLRYRMSTENTRNILFENKMEIGKFR